LELGWFKLFEVLSAGRYRMYRSLFLSLNPTDLLTALNLFL